MKATDTQVGGDHYKKLKIQPAEYIHANNIGYFEGNVIKYVSRWRDKNGVTDLEKAKHYIDLLIQLEGAVSEANTKPVTVSAVGISGASYYVPGQFSGGPV